MIVMFSLLQINTGSIDTVTFAHKDTHLNLDETC